jgi:uncharacterized protein YkwD
VKSLSPFKAGLAATFVAASLIAVTGLPANAATSIPATTATTTSAPSYASEKAELLNFINNYRTSKGLTPLVINNSLGSVAQDWSGTTASQGGFKHNPSFSTQIPQRWTYAAEIIGAAETPEEVFLGWVNSYSHNEVLTELKAREIGFGYAFQGNLAGEYPSMYYASAIVASYEGAPPLTTPVSAAAPTFGVGMYTLPTSKGVTYRANGIGKPAGSYPGVGTVTVIAVPDNGYTISGTSSWTHTFAPVVTQPVPVTPTPTPTPVTPKPTPTPTPVPVPVVKSPIALKAATLNGSLGLATSKEITGIKNGGSYQTYQKGAIYWTSATGAKVVRGAIQSVWNSRSAQNGVLGYPTSDEYKVLTGMAQNFQVGKIYYSSTKGTFVVRGAIGSRYDSSNGTGNLGLPVSNEIGGLKNGGVYQKFEKGVIYWSPATGAWFSKGAIRSAYAKVGYEKSRLGYPTSNEYAVIGGVAQKYQGGIITWNSKTGATKVTYK